MGDKGGAVGDAEGLGALQEGLHEGAAESQVLILREDGEGVDQDRAAFFFVGACRGGGGWVGG